VVTTNNNNIDMITKHLLGTKLKVQEDGKIFSNGKELAINTTGTYDMVKISIKGRYRNFRVDYVVANSFFPLLDEDGEVIHLDYDLHNHSYTNLQWISFESDIAIDALTNDCLILCIDVFTSNLISFYRGERHVCIKNNTTLEELTPHLIQPIIPINNKLFFRLIDINVIDINTAYMIFEVSDKMYVIRYNQDMMYKLVKLLKNE